MITWLIITKNYNLASQIFHYVEIFKILPSVFQEITFAMVERGET